MTSYPGGLDTVPLLGEGHPGIQEVEAGAEIEAELVKVIQESPHHLIGGERTLVIGSHTVRQGNVTSQAEKGHQQEDRILHLSEGTAQTVIHQARRKCQDHNRNPTKLFHLLSV